MPDYVLGIDGGASFSRAAVIDPGSKEIIWSKEGDACNVLLSSRHEIHQLMQSYSKAISEKKISLNTVGLCLAGVTSKTIQKRVQEIAQSIWKETSIHVTHDLDSALYSGITDGQGIVALCGTGACVYGQANELNYKMGGWGHILGDEGSAYNIAHKALRWIIEYYDQNESLDELGDEILNTAKVSSLSQLARYVNNFGKREIAKLSIPVFDAGENGHEGARQIIQNSANYLAKNCLQVSQKLSLSDPLITKAGGVFANSEIFNSFFHDSINTHIPKAKLMDPNKNPAYGACLWTLQKKDSSKTVSPHLTTPKKIVEEFSLRELDQVNIDNLATEKRNPNTKNLHKLSTKEAVSLFIEEDRKIIPALQEASDDISRMIDIASQCLLNNGRIIYVGAGTSGRLGILDASECPPTFSADPQQVLGLIAGGTIAVTRAVEGAEDFRDRGAFDILNKKVSENDFVCGIAASGRTPYVWGALEKSRELNAQTGLIHCNPPFNNSLPFNPDVVVALNSGPETLTGSTRLRAGTLTKMVLNILSTLSMLKMGKVWSNFMVDVKPTNNKLKARAIALVSTLNTISKEEAYKLLILNNWHVKSCLKKDQSA
jgi:N-acetylmuramic acid 6-phosphate etherase